MITVRTMMIGMTNARPLLTLLKTNGINDDDCGEISEAHKQML
jgi:hypothetical protein